MKPYLFFFALLLSIPFIVPAQSLMWGLTSQGGVSDSGVIFSFDPVTKEEIVHHSFTGGSDAAYPLYCSLIKPADGLLYGLSHFGGSYSQGTIFNYNMNTGIETVVHNFGGTNGKWPNGSLVEANDGLLYGVTGAGGTYGGGTLFSYNTSTNEQKNLYQFNVNGTLPYAPYGTLIQGNDGLLYGVTQSGGQYFGGTLFSFDISQKKLVVLHDFGQGQDGAWPRGKLLIVDDSLVYGTTASGGLFNGGVSFLYNIKTGTETVLHDFGNSDDGDYPEAGMFYRDGILYGLTVHDQGFMYKGTLYEYNIATETQKVLSYFGKKPNYGENPTCPLIQGIDGLLYGVSESGGMYGRGTIFTYDISADTLITVYNFKSDSDGFVAIGGLLEVIKPVNTSTGNTIKSDKLDAKIFPTVTADEFKISWSADISEVTIEIYNTVGTRIFADTYKQYASHSMLLNIKDDAAGVYLVRITGAGETKVLKVVKQ